MEADNKTTMNISQLDKMIQDQSSEIERQTKQIEELQEKCDRLESVVYQLIGGLFCQRTQSYVIDMHLNNLFGREQDKSIKIDSNDIWPTTRQGYECMQKITLLEEKLEKVRNALSN